MVTEATVQLSLVEDRVKHRHLQQALDGGQGGGEDGRIQRRHRVAQEADDEEGSYAPAMYLPAPDADPAVQVEREEWDGASSYALAAALEGLDARSRRIIETRWLAEDKLTLHDLADEFGVSAERVRQIETNAMKKLRAAIGDR